MDAETVSRFLVLYNAFVIAGLLTFCALIARFYQRSTGERTVYPGFLGAIVLVAAASIHWANTRVLGGDGLSHALSFAAGLVALGLTLHLYRLMTRGR